MSQELVERLCRRVLQLKLPQLAGEGAPGHEPAVGLQQEQVHIAHELHMSLGCFRELPQSLGRDVEAPCRC